MKQNANILMEMKLFIRSIARWSNSSVVIIRKRIKEIIDFFSRARICVKKAVRIVFRHVTRALYLITHSPAARMQLCNSCARV